MRSRRSAPRSRAWCPSTTSTTRRRPRASPPATRRRAACRATRTATRVSAHSPSSRDRVAETWLAGKRDRGAGECRPGHARGRHRDDARPRPRGDRGDHELHQHLEPVGDDRRGHPRAQRRRARSALEAVGQDLARPGLEGGHRVPRPRRADRAARAARLQSRRLRLHDLHRELRPAPGGDLAGRQRTTTWRWSRCSRATATSRGGSTPT